MKYTRNELQKIDIFDAIEDAKAHHCSVAFHYGLSEKNRFDEIKTWFLNTQLHNPQINRNELTHIQIHQRTGISPNIVGDLQKRNYAEKITLDTAQRIADAISTPDNPVEIDDLLGLTYELKPLLPLRFRELCDRYNINTGNIRRIFPGVNGYTLICLYRFSSAGELRTSTLLSICERLHVSLEYMLFRSERNIVNPSYDAITYDPDAGKNGCGALIPKSRFQELLKATHRSIHSVEQELGLNTQRIRRLKNLTGKPIDLELAIQLSDFFNVTLDYFYDLTPLNTKLPESEWPEYLAMEQLSQDAQGRIPVLKKVAEKKEYQWIIGKVEPR